MNLNARKGNNKMKKLLILAPVSFLLLASTPLVFAAGENSPGWADRGNKGDSPGWSQNNPGAGGSEGPGQGPRGSFEVEVESPRSSATSGKPPGWSHQNPGSGGTDDPGPGPHSSK